MQDVTRLSPGARKACQVLGPLLLLAGLACIGIFFASFMSSFGSFDFQMPPIWLFFLAMPLFFVGAILTNIGYMRPMSGIVATETEGAVEVTAGAIGRGLGQMGIGRAAAPATITKVRCRACGFLESEDARFCSQCRAAV